MRWLHKLNTPVVDVVDVDEDSDGTEHMVAEKQNSIWRNAWSNEHGIHSKIIVYSQLNSVHTHEFIITVHAWHHTKLSIYTGTHIIYTVAIGQKKQSEICRTHKSVIILQVIRITAKIKSTCGFAENIYIKYLWRI